MEEYHYHAVLQQKWLEDFSGGQKSQPLFKSLERHFPSSSALQMMHFNVIYQKICQNLAMYTEKVASLQALYWQELFLIWQRLILNEAVKNKKDLTLFMKEYYILHMRHFGGLLKIADNLNQGNIAKTRLNIKHLMDICIPHDIVESDFEEWKSVLEEQGAKLLQSLQAIEDLTQLVHNMA